MCGNTKASQFNFICIAPIHNRSYLRTLQIEQVKTELFITLFTETQQYHHEQALGDKGKEKLPVKRQKPRTDPSALGGWSSVSTSWGEGGRERERERERQLHSNNSIGSGNPAGPRQEAPPGSIRPCETRKHKNSGEEVKLVTCMNECSKLEEGGAQCIMGNPPIV